MLNSFPYTCWPSVMSSLEKMSIQTFSPLFFFFWPLTCMSFLYILDINFLSDMWFVNIFFHLVCCLFILLMVSFSMQNLFGLMKTHLFIFAFVAFSFGVRFKKSRPVSMSLPPKNFYIWMYQGYWSAIFFSCSILLWFCFVLFCLNILFYLFFFF